MSEQARASFTGDETQEERAESTPRGEPESGNWEAREPSGTLSTGAKAEQINSAPEVGAPTGSGHAPYRDEVERLALKAEQMAAGAENAHRILAVPSIGGRLHQASTEPSYHEQEAADWRTVASLLRSHPDPDGQLRRLYAGLSKTLRVEGYEMPDTPGPVPPNAEVQP